VLASGGGNGNIMLTTATLPVTGNYTITVDPNAADTGSMSVIVTNP
jgi:hypothetical protein